MTYISAKFAKLEAGVSERPHFRGFGCAGLALLGAGVAAAIATDERQHERQRRRERQEARASGG